MSLYKDGNKLHKSQAPGHPGDLYSGTSYSATIIAFLFLTYKNVYHCTYTEQKALDNSDVHMSHQNCGSSVGNLPHVNLQTPEIWR